VLYAADEAGVKPNVLLWKAEQTWENDREDDL
jgi:hypothetical protein